MVSKQNDPIPFNNSACSFDIDLHAGWNIIGNPYNKDISWIDIQTLNAINSPLWQYDDRSARWNSVSTITPFEGYYVFTEAATSLTIPFTDLTQNSIANQENHWIELLVKGQGDTLATVYASFTDQAKLDLDAFDHIGPRSGFSKATLSFIPQSAKSTKLAIEARPLKEEGQIFNLLLENKTEETVYIELGRSDLPNQYSLILVDKEWGTLSDLYDSDSARLLQGKGTRTYTLFVGLEQHKAEGESPTTPSTITLSPNYPNPLINRTTIGYTLPAGDWIRVEIFDVLGRHIKTLVDSYQDSGVYRVEWDGRHEAGFFSANGVYILQLKTSSSQLTQKMLIQR